MRTSILWLALTALAIARPVVSPRGLVEFDVPDHLKQIGSSTWGSSPGVVIELRERFAPKGKLKDLQLEMTLPSPQRKKKGEGGVDIEGADEARKIGIEDGSRYTQYYFARRGNYSFGWSVSSYQGTKAEMEGIGESLRSTIKFRPDPSASNPEQGGEAHQITDSTGNLSLSLPGNFSAKGPRKYTNGEVMVIVNTMQNAADDTLQKFCFTYNPPGFKPYLRRNHVEMGEQEGALIQATSDDGKLESQFVMLRQGKIAVLLSFVAPVANKGQLDVLRETIAGQAKWRNGDEDKKKKD